MSEISSVGPSTSNRLTEKGGFLRVLSYWFNLAAQPTLGILFVLGLAWLFGYTQRNFNWFNGNAVSEASSDAEEESLFACSMLCVFVKAPGRCPVCGMELQKVDVPGDPKDIFGVTIEPTARRLANIKTVVAVNQSISKEIEVLGKITYDQTKESTISAYIDGRIVELFADFRGADVRKGEPLAVVYSPDLYADQVGLLNARKLLKSNAVGSKRISEANQRLYSSARRRLIEFGLSESQVDEIEKKGKPDSHIRIVSPMSGTCVQKIVSEGDYIKTGKPLLKIADLSSVWLMLEMFPEDTCNLKIGQNVKVNIPSQIGKQFEGKVSFVEPMVNQKTNTVNVRVEIPNKTGTIKIGDFGRARIQTNHELNDEMVIVPRQAVLVNGSDSIAYVETEPGRFEFRRVEVAQTLGDQILISSGIKPGEMVVASGVFMLDSTFNIQGKVSLIDPNRAIRKDQAKLSATEEAREIESAFSKLSPEDRKLAEQQVICPVMEVKLGSSGMGSPIRVKLPDQDVMICCKGCKKKLLADPKKYYEVLAAYRKNEPTEEERKEMNKSFAPLSPADRKLAEQQVICPVTEVRLGTKGMGTPIRVKVSGKEVMICCEGCRSNLQKDPETYFQILENYRKGRSTNTPNESEENGNSSEIPQMELPTMELPK